MDGVPRYITGQEAEELSIQSSRPIEDVTSSYDPKEELNRDSRRQELIESLKTFFGCRYIVLTSCGLSALSLCLRHKKINATTLPRQTSMRVPLLLSYLGIDFAWDPTEWTDCYPLGDSGIIDGALLNIRNSYVTNTLTCLSFSFGSPSGAGIGGAILLDDLESFVELRKLLADSEKESLLFGKGSSNEDFLFEGEYSMHWTVVDKVIATIDNLGNPDFLPRPYPDLTEDELFNGFTFDKCPKEKLPKMLHMSSKWASTSSMLNKHRESALTS